MIKVTLSQAISSSSRISVESLNTRGPISSNIPIVENTEFYISVSWRCWRMLQVQILWLVFWEFRWLRLLDYRRDNNLLYREYNIIVLLMNIYSVIVPRGCKLKVEGFQMHMLLRSQTFSSINSIPRRGNLKIFQELWRSGILRVGERRQVWWSKMFFDDHS